MKTNTRITTLRLHVIVIISVLSRVPSLSQIQTPYVERNSCPFECCQFGLWVARTGLKAFLSEGDTTNVAFRVAQNDTIIAVTGNVHMEKLGKILVTKPIYGFLPGDTLYATHCLGEEEFEIWHDGRSFRVEIFWKTPNTANEYDFAPEQDDSLFSGIMLSKPVMVWWIQIKNMRRETGWLRLVNRILYCFMLKERIDGIDGCG